MEEVTLDTSRLIEAFGEANKFKAYALFLLVAFVAAEAGNYQKGQTLSRICFLLEERLPETYSKKPRMQMEEIAKLCSAYNSDVAPASD